MWYKIISMAIVLLLVLPKKLRNMILTNTQLSSIGICSCVWNVFMHAYVYLSLCIHPWLQCLDAICTAMCLPLFRFNMYVPCIFQTTLWMWFTPAISSSVNFQSAFSWVYTRDGSLYIVPLCYVGIKLSLSKWRFEFHFDPFSRSLTVIGSEAKCLHTESVWGAVFCVPSSSDLPTCAEGKLSW